MIARIHPKGATAPLRCHNGPMRFFSTEGPVRPHLHYVIPPLERVGVEELLGLIRDERYFVLYAPRQTGRTSGLWQRVVVECKVLRDSDRKSMEGAIDRGMEQTLGYMAKCRAEEGHLVVFDRREEAGERRRDGKAGAEPSERRQDGRSLTLWTL